MKAIVYLSFGQPENLQLQDVTTPFPKDNEVLIRIRATTAAVMNLQVRRSKTPRPIIPGQDLAGEIEAIGRKVTRFKKGDQVIAWSGLRLGTYAECTCLPEKAVMFIKPSCMTYEEAATVPVAGLDAAYLFRKANIQRGEKVLINGAVGNMGTYAIQIAKRFGAEVTGVDSADKLDMLRSLGADRVIDYAREDFTQSGNTYDVIFDVVGNHSFANIMNRLNLHGRYLTAIPQLSQIILGQWSAWMKSKKVIFWMPRTVGGYAKDFAFIKNLIEDGSVKAIIDKRFPLEQTAEAQRYVESGHKLGHVVITVAQDPIQ